MEIPKYSALVLDYITAKQREKLIEAHGLDFQKKLSEIFPSKDHFLNHIEEALNQEFRNDSDEKFELEALLKNNAVDDVVNRTEYEFSQHKSLLNSAELTFRGVTNPEYLEKIPYSATLYSFDLNAEILHFKALDKPLVFFHSGLFSVNLMFCKLFIKLIRDTAIDDANAVYSQFAVKEDNKSIEEVNLCAVSFYNYYLSNRSDEIPNYNITTPFENNILAIFLNSITLFVYSHETGHALLKHKINDNDIPEEEIWKDEFEADQFAMVHLKNYCRANPSTAILSLLGPIVFFRYRVLIEKYEPLIGTKQSHPPTNDRLERYVLWLAREYSTDREILGRYFDLEEKISKILFNLFDQIHKVAQNSKFRPST